MVITGLTRNQLGSNPPRVRISPSPPYKKQVHFCAPVFLYNARFEKGNAKHRNSPGDCFGARVRAAERISAAGESRRSARNAVQDNLYCFYFFADYISNCQIHLTTNHFSALKSFSNKYKVIVITQPQFDKF